MPNYLVQVTHTYPVQAVSPEDALNTLPQVIKMRFIGCMAEGHAEIIDAETKQLLLVARLDAGRIS